MLFRLRTSESVWRKRKHIRFTLYVNMGTVPVVQPKGQQREEHGRGGGQLVLALTQSGLHDEEALVFILCVF